MSKTSKPRAVLISDIHFTPSTLELASTSLRLALEKAASLNVPIVIAGDTLDTKAVIRGECANRLIEILSDVAFKDVPRYMLVGNHDLISEKACEHSLNFLVPYCDVVDRSDYFPEIDCYLIPYMNSSQELQQLLDSLPKGATLIMHQGVQTAYMGHYVQDKSSLPPEAFADFRVISGHYHRRQDIKCGRPRKGAVGLFSYIGNPYSLSFGEAEDGPKGFQILMDDGSLEFVPINLRRHRIWEMRSDDFWSLMMQGPIAGLSPGDLNWLKIYGPSEMLTKIDKSAFAAKVGTSNFKLDKIPTDAPVEKKPVEGLSDAQVLDGLIQQTSEKDAEILMALWRELIA